MSKITYIDGVYIKYRKMWKEDRWQFSNEQIQLRMRKNGVGLTDDEQHALNMMNRVEEENGYNWMESNNRLQRKRAGI